jgi:serine/threonine-protein kinase RsbW
LNYGTSDASRLEVPAHLDSLGPVRDFVGSTLAGLGLGDDAAGELLLAVDEAVSNVVMHGGTDGQGVLEVAVLPGTDAVTVRIRDDARQYDPTGTAAPRLDVSPLDREQAGGFGVELIRRLVDRVGYRVADDGRNELTLVKHRRAG